MKIAFLADCHIANFKRFGGEMHAGLNARCRLALQALERALRTAETAECETCVIAGDLFDSHRVEAPVLVAVMQLLAESTMRFYVVAGNHDVASHEHGDSALAPLRFVPTVMVVAERPCVTSTGRGGASNRVELVLVPYTGSEVLRVLERAVPKRAPRCAARRVLVCHAGLIDNATSPFLLNARDAIAHDTLDALMRRTSIDLVAMGHWHPPRHHETYDTGVKNVRHIVQCGALAPSRHDDPGFALLTVYDSRDNSITRHGVPGPRFLRFDGLNAAMLDVAHRTDCFMFARCIVPLAQLADAKAYAATIENERADWLSIECVADEEVANIARTEARERAAMAVRAQSIERAVEEYIAAMPLPCSVDRSELLILVRNMITGKP